MLLLVRTSTSSRAASTAKATRSGLDARPGGQYYFRYHGTFGWADGIAVDRVDPDAARIEVQCKNSASTLNLMFDFFVSPPRQLCLMSRHNR